MVENFNQSTTSVVKQNGVKNDTITICVNVKCSRVYARNEIPEMKIANSEIDSNRTIKQYKGNRNSVNRGNKRVKEGTNLIE